MSIDSPQIKSQHNSISRLNLTQRDFSKGILRRYSFGTSEEPFITAVNNSIK